MLGIIKDRRRVFAAMGIIAVAASFWAGSRYPALQSKGDGASDPVMSSSLGFHALVEFSTNENVFLRILLNTINWIDNNLQGMVFGILFAATVLTLFTLFKIRQAEGHWKSTLLGLGIGAPLGVCVNCATPVSQGLHHSGMRLGVTLTALFSSPSLNIVVLSIMFAIFPFYLAVLKLAFTFLFLIVIVPIAIRLCGVQPDGEICEVDGAFDPENRMYPSHDRVELNWGQSFAWYCREYLRNLLYILRITVPWMLLAGLLGATAVTIVPWDRFTSWLESLDTWQHGIGIIVSAAFGLFLPVPIAFDVIFPASLMDQGLSPAYAGTLLFSLGIFSIYPFIVIGRSMGWKLAHFLAISLLILSTLVGICSHTAGKWAAEAINREVFSTKESLRQIGSESNEYHDLPGTANTASYLVNEAKIQFMEFKSTGEIEISRAPYNKAEGNNSDSMYSKVDISESGLSSPYEPFHIARYSLYHPVSYSRALVAGDLQNDGWPDLITDTPGGLIVYINEGNSGFTQSLLDLGLGPTAKIMVTGTADIDNDGFLDLVVCTLQHGNYLIMNKSGVLDTDSKLKLPNQPNAIYTNAIAFADLDSNGILEIVLGNHWIEQGFARPDLDSRIPEMEHARNAILRLGEHGWQIQDLPGIPGPTLSILASDLDDDMDVDLLIGNDFMWPNTIYLNDGSGGLDLIRSTDGILPETTRTTMSIDTADFDNDLDLDMFWAQVTNTSGENLFSDSGLRTQSADSICDGYIDTDWHEQCEASMRIHKYAAQKRNTKRCGKLSRREEVTQCKGSILFVDSVRRFDRDSCLALLGESRPGLEYICNRENDRDTATIKQMRSNDERLKIRDRDDYYNTFLVNQGGKFIEVAKDFGLDVTGWSWNAKFADLDNDGWQDIYVVNGFYFRRARESNYYFTNQSGTAFSDNTLESGLEDYLPSGSYVYADFDLDGDLDIVSAPFHGPLNYYSNNTVGNNSISFKLEDNIGNTRGINSKLTITYAGDQHQIREIKSSGGYQSFDPATAHFGLGKHKIVERLTINWSTGESNTIDGPFDANFFYVVKRR